MLKAIKKLLRLDWAERIEPIKANNLNLIMSQRNRHYLEDKRFSFRVGKYE